MRYLIVKSQSRERERAVLQSHRSLTVAALTVAALTVAALTVAALTVAALTVAALTVAALTVAALMVAALMILPRIYGVVLFSASVTDSKPKTHLTGSPDK